MDNTLNQFNLTFEEEGKRVRLDSRVKKTKKGYASPWYYYLGLVGHIGFVIAVPIVGGALLGQYIDERWSIYPKATLSLLMIGTALGMMAFIRALKDVMEK